LEGLKEENHRHFRSDHGHLNAAESLVPMIFVFGSDQGTRAHSTLCHASVVDVTPTVLALLGLLPSYEEELKARPLGLKGHSLKAHLEGSLQDDHRASLCAPGQL
jgi:hypothetical protein